MTPLARLSLVLLLTATANASAQSGGGGGFVPTTPPDLAPSMRYPERPEIAWFAPWATPALLPGQPPTTHRNTIGAAGSVDFDRDGIDELWFVAADGPDAGTLSVQRARDGDIHRYRPYPGASIPSALTATDAATYARDGDGRARLLLIGPGYPGPMTLRHRLVVPAPGHVLETTTWSIEGTLYAPSAGAAYEIESETVAGLEWPDVYTLLGGPSLGGVETTTVRKEVVDPTTTLPMAPRDLLLPTRCDTLRVGDFDGDGESDFVVHLPGLGIATFVETSVAPTPVTPAGFRFLGLLPLPAGALRDLAVGDLNQDGKDDLAVVLADGVLLFSTGDQPGATPLDTLLAAVPRPTGLGSLASAVIVDSYDDTAQELVLLPVDGLAFAMLPWRQAQQGFTSPVLRTPEDAAPFTGPGVLGQAAIRGDLDSDGDLDLAIQTAGGEWFAMQGPHVDQSPRSGHVFGPPTPSPFLTVSDILSVVFADAAQLPQPAPQNYEVALYHQDGGSIGLIHSEIHPLLLGQTSASVNVELRASGLPMPPGTLTTSGPSLVSIHLIDGNRRFPAALFYHDGNAQTDGSAVGARWRLVATPPLPDVDDELLPWN